MLATAFTLIRGRLTPDANGDVAQLLTHSAVPGLIDYTIQYYTVLLVSIFWIFAWGSGVLGFYQKANGIKLDCFKGGSPSKGQIIVYLVLGSLLCAWVVFAILFGGVATPEVLHKYLVTTKALGKVQLPILSSPLFLMRCSLGVHLISMSFYTVTPFNTHKS